MHACTVVLHFWKTHMSPLLVLFHFGYQPNISKKCYIAQKLTVSFIMQCWSSYLQIKSTLESILCCFCYSPEHILPTFPILKNQTSKTDTDAKIPLLLQILEGLGALRRLPLLRDDFPLRQVLSLLQNRQQPSDLSQALGKTFPEIRICHTDICPAVRADR